MIIIIMVTARTAAARKKSFNRVGFTLKLMYPVPSSVYIISWRQYVIYIIRNNNNNDNNLSKILV